MPRPSLPPRTTFLVPLTPLLILAATAGAAHADTLFFASLTNAQENPPAIPTTAAGTPRPASFGVATFVLNDAQTALTFSATITNIDFTGLQTLDVNDNLLAAHIHASATVTPTTNAPVVWGFFGAPLNDNNPNDVLFAPFSAGVGGVISGKWDLAEGNNTTLTAQLPNILSGNSYINFHTTQFPGGEIRGQILPTAIPEPGTLALLGTAAAAGVLPLVRAAARRRRVC